MDVWEWTPLIALIVLAGLASMPGQVLEAAKIDGASYWQRLRHIVLPMIAGVIVVALLIRSMDAIRYFDIIQNTTNGGPADATKIIPIRLYETAFRFFDLGYAAAIGLSMLAASILVANLFLKTLHKTGAGEMKGGRIGVRVLIGVILLWTVVPLAWMVLSSLKPADKLTSNPPSARLHADVPALLGPVRGNDIGGYAVNSIIAAGVSTLIAVALGCLAGYGLARSRFRGKDHVSFWIISTRMAPIAAVVLPLFVIFRGHRPARHDDRADRGLPDLQPAVRDLDHERVLRRPAAALEEAAMVDGASRWTAFRRIALPLVLPGIATTTVLCLVFSWNDYAFASTFSGPDSQTLPIAASQLVTQTEIDWGQLTAIGTIVVAPMIVVGLVVRRWLVTGLTLGAVTGE